MPRGYRDEDEADEVFEIEGCRALAVSRSGKALKVKMPREGSRFEDFEWIPISQIHADSEVFETGHEGRLVVTRWFAGERGWV